VSYNVRLAELTKQVREQIGTIPPSHRFMIVFHNAWQYYNVRFGITTLGSMVGAQNLNFAISAADYWE